MKTLFLLFLTSASVMAQELASQIDALLPALANENLEARFEPQMAFQDLAAHAGRPGAEAERKAFCVIALERLANDATPQPARVWIARQLEHVGAAESVETLASLLASPDVELRDVARRALEKNSAPAASDALLAALNAGGDVAMRAGLVSALGERRVAAAVGSIAAQLDDADVLPAAAGALGKIGGSASLDALGKALESASGPAAASLAQAAVQVLESQEAAGPMLQQLVDKASLPSSVRASAFIRLVSEQPNPHILKASLMNDDSMISRAAIRLAANSVDSVSALAIELPNIPAHKQLQVLGLIADAGKGTSLDPVRPFLASGDEALKIAAVQAVAGVQSAQSAELLVEQAATAGGAVASAAKSSLSRLEGAAVQMKLESLAKSGEPALRSVAIRTYLDRAAPNTEPLMHAFMADEDAGISAAALQVLEKVGTAKSVTPLIELIKSRPQGLRALKTIANRARATEGLSDTLIAAIPEAGPDKVIGEYLSILAVVGDAKALQRVQSSLGGVQSKSAIRALSDWPDASALPALMKVAADVAIPESEHVLSVRGLVRLIETASTAKAADRAAWTADLYTTARRPEERQQVVALLGQLVHPDMVPTTLEALASGEAKAETQLSAITLAEGLTKAKQKDAAKQVAIALRDQSPDGDVAKRLQALLKKLK